MMSVHGNLYDLGQDDYRGSPRSDFYLDLQQEKVKSQDKLIHPAVTSSDALNLSLNTPDITTLLSEVAQPSSSITTQAPTPNSFLLSRGPVTEEQEMYAQGFLEALDQLHTTSSRDLTRPPTSVTLPGQNLPRQPAAGNHHKGLSSGPVVHQHLSSPPVATGPNPTLEAVAPFVTATLYDIPNISSSSQPEATTAFMRGSSTMNYATNNYPPFSMYSGSQAVDASAFGGYTTPGISSAAHIMGGPAVPSPPMQSVVVPADLQTQEQMKEERKKARNRLAASKCRIRRLQRESELQNKVKALKEHNLELNTEVTDLKEQINNLKKALIQHMKGGCHVNFPEGYVLEPTE